MKRVLKHESPWLTVSGAQARVLDPRGRELLKYDHGYGRMAADLTPPYVKERAKSLLRLLKLTLEKTKSQGEEY